MVNFAVYFRVSTSRTWRTRMRTFRNLFNHYDLDGNGEIDQDELYAIVDDMLHNKASSIYIVQVKLFH